MKLAKGSNEPNFYMLDYWPVLSNIFSHVFLNMPNHGKAHGSTKYNWKACENRVTITSKLSFLIGIQNK